MWYFAGVLATGAAALIARGVYRRNHQRSAARAAGLAPCADLTHVSAALQATALWRLSDGGFERRPAHGVVTRRAHDLDVTAFDLETLRERRGEWAHLVVDAPFRIGPLVTVVVCELPRALPTALLKHTGAGDDLADDPLLERVAHAHKIARDTLGIARAYPVDPPPDLAARAELPELPADWRAYTLATGELAALLAGGLATALARANRRDLVVELRDSLVVIYPAMAEVVGPDAFADLVATAIALADAILGAMPAVSPRGVEPQRP